MVCVTLTQAAGKGTVRWTRTDSLRLPPSDPYIYHHKWLFVADDYPGFDVAESIARSAAWLALPDVDRRRIGGLSYWAAAVLPRLPTPLGSP